MEQLHILSNFNSELIHWCDTNLDKIYKMYNNVALSYPNEFL